MYPRSSRICASAASQLVLTSALISFRSCVTSSRVAVFRPIAHVAPIADRITVTITAAVAIHA